MLLNIVSAPNFRAAVRDARRRVQGVFASLTVAGDTDSVGVEIIDTSYGGIAFLSANELAVSTKGLLALETKKYETEIRITVRNCSQVGSGENNQYRIGATVQALSRLGEALWRNFVDDPMDAPMVEEQAPEQAA